MSTADSPRSWTSVRGGSPTRRFDAAWWGWVVRYHHPAVWSAIWPTFLAAAGLPTGGAESTAIRALQLLQVLELAAEAGANAAQRETWLERLAVISGWD